MTATVELSAFDRVFPDSQLVVAEWKVWLSAVHRPKTVSGYAGHIRRLLDHTDKPVHDITEADLIDYMTRFGPNSASRQGIYYASRSLWRFGVRRGHLLGDITTGIPAPRVREKTPDALSQEELIRVVHAADNRHLLRGLVMRFLYYTGARINEATAARWHDIIDGNLHLRDTKGGDERAVPISEALGYVLSALHDFRVDDRILPRVAGTIEAWCAQAGKEARIGRRVYPHLFRATTATTLLDNGTPVQVASQLLGHKNIKTTSRYLATKDKGLRKAVESL